MWHLANQSSYLVQYNILWYIHYDVVKKCQMKAQNRFEVWFEFITVVVVCCTINDNAQFKTTITTSKLGNYNAVHIDGSLNNYLKNKL